MTRNGGSLKDELHLWSRSDEGQLDRFSRGGKEKGSPASPTRAPRKTLTQTKKAENILTVPQCPGRGKKGRIFAPTARARPICSHF